ncbi:MAG: hypothetical protein Q9210_003030 [Variospora velana]
MAESSFKIVRGHGAFKCADYNVAWICALRDTELLAARGLLDEEHTTPPYDTKYDRNTYICGKIGEHKVVVACMPSGRSGNVNAGHLTGPLFHTFPNIKITLLVGIGGGVPRQGPQDLLEDIYLGDVVIGWPGDGTPAVVQYDSGRWKVDGFEQRGSVDQPDWHLTQALDVVVSNHEVGQTDFPKSIARLRKIPKPGRAEARPEGLFRFHLGTIASGGAVIQDGEMRDRLSRECNNARCLEMEAVGVNLNSRCLVIRGLADYADSHKNDAWKYVAAGNAAAFAKEFLLTIKGSGLRELSGIVADQKTVQYCHKHRQKTPECHIFWVYGSTRQSFDDAYRTIAKELEIPGCDDPLFEHRKAVPRELDRQETGPWIMIIDNADDYNIYFPPLDAALSESEQGEYLAYCLPIGAENGGRLVVTTRNHRVGADIMGDSPIIEISELAPNDARKLLQSKVPKEKWEDVAADMLLKELDYLPLAITQAAAFVKRNKLTSLKFYLGKLCSSHLNVQDVLSYNKLLDSRRQPGTPSAIFRTWQISYRQIEMENNKAAVMLCLMAVLDNQSIPQVLLAEEDELDMAELDAVQLLLDFSLVKGDANQQTFSMHPLQQLSTQNWLRLDNSRLKEWEEYGLLLLSIKMPSFDSQKEHMRHRCSILLPHARIVVSYETKKLHDRSELLLKMSQYEEDLGRYQECYQHAIQAYEESVEAFGKNSLLTQLCKVQVEIALKNTYGREDEAEKFGEDCSEEFETGEVDEKDEAEPAWDSAAIQLLSTDPAHGDLAFSFYQKALDRFMACSNNIRALSCLESQAFILEKQGKIEESESLLRQSLSLSLNVYGDKHSKVFDCMCDLGRMVGKKQGKLAEAAQLHRLALRGRKEIYGMEHPSTMLSKRHLASVLREQGHHVEAEILGSQSLKGLQRHFGWHHVDTKLAVNDFVITLYEMERPEEARALRAIANFHHWLVPATFGVDDGSIPFTKDNLLEAERFLRKALEDAREQNGHAQPDAIILSERLAHCHEMQEKRDEITEICRKLELHER